MNSNGLRPTGGVSRGTTTYSQRKSVWLLLCLTVVIALLLVACTETSRLDNSTTPETLASGSDDLARDFQITAYQGENILGGQEINFSDLLAQGNPVVLNMWAGLCPPCRAEMPDLQKFYEGSKDDVVLLGIDIGQFTGLGNRQDARDLLEELNVTYPAGFTTGGGVPRDYKVLGMPTTVFINSKGEIFENWTGALNREILDRITEAMLSEEGVAASSP